MALRIAPQRPVTPKGIKRLKVKSDRKNWDAIANLGCIICGCYANIHHCFTGSGGRKDDSKVIPLCYEHHQGEQGIHTIGRKQWQSQYGSEQELIEKVKSLLGEE